MPRLSLWKPEKGNDYKFIDRTISEMFGIGGTDLYVYKYLGTNNSATGTDATLPHYDKTEPTNIQDLLFQENRDRKYDKNIYRLRGQYNVQNLDFDLSQFGLFLTNDIIFIVVHYNDMIDVVGRKLMVGDVFELPHLTDYHPLNETIPIGLRRYYQITDANYASEGFSVTWWPHLWRIKCEPLVNTQEFADILNQPLQKDNYLGDWDPSKPYVPGYTVSYGGDIYTPKQPGPVPPGTLPTDTTYWDRIPNGTLSDVVTTYNKNIQINDALVEEARRLVPKQGYNRQQLYVVPTFINGEPGLPSNVVINADVPAFPTGPIITVAGTAVVSMTIDNPVGIGSKHSIIIQSATVLPQYTDTGSGPVEPQSCLICESIGPDAGPYGTADSTESRADQYITEIVTSVNTAVNSTTISALSLPASLTPQVSVSATVRSPNGTTNALFPSNTRIVSVHAATNSFTINTGTLFTISAGTAITLNENFDGTVTPYMDYRADANPRFRFIRRDTPRSFGWLAGYNTGDGSAPNGEPVGRGIAFPATPNSGDYFLRTDYLPQKLYRFDGVKWVEIDRAVRTATGFGLDDQSQLSSFINNTATIATSEGTVIPSRQSLSKAFNIKPD